MVNLTRELGLEYARQGIQVNALCPGFYQTSLSRGAIDDAQVRATITAFIPMGGSRGPPRSKARRSSSPQPHPTT